jgi:hypothetical protein
VVAHRSGGRELEKTEFEPLRCDAGGGGVLDPYFTP